MKKESEVLQAAQSGNVAKLEVLFEQRSSKVFAGFFKGPNINWRNENGCTALHLAALNGHKDVVILLLHNDASANIPDNAGSFPLHLAAFNGHAEIASILIERGPSKAEVNETNITGDTALHVAAQFNHHAVISVLLKNHSDIFLRNIKDETALDLAAQYGRFYAVQMLIYKDLTILKDAVHKHSPLHLAARNGHLKVVKLLLSSGMPVSATCDMGTALHTSALFGKVNVAKLLLKKGIDIEIENDNGETVLDLLCKMPSQISQQITALIYEHSGGMDNISLTSKKSTMESKNTQTMTMEETKLSSYDYVPKFRNTSAESGGVYPYAVVEGLGKKAGHRLSSNTEAFDLASLTGKKEEDQLESPNETQTRGSYRLVDISSHTLVTDNKKVKPSIKQKRTVTSKARSLELMDDELNNDIYIELGTGKQHITSCRTNSMMKSEPVILPGRMGAPENNNAREALYHVPPKFDGNSSSVPDFLPPSSRTSNILIANIIETAKIDTQSLNQLNIINDSINKSGTFSAREQAMLSDAANNLLGIKHLSKSVPMNIGVGVKTGFVGKYSSSHNNDANQDTYDNVNLKNVPTTEKFDTYDNVNLCSSLKNVPAAQLHDTYDNVNLCSISVPDNEIFETYDNVNLSHGEARSSYDNVHIKNIPMPQIFKTVQEGNHEKSVKQKRTSYGAKQSSYEAINVKNVISTDNVNKHIPCVDLLLTEEPGMVETSKKEENNDNNILIPIKVDIPSKKQNLIDHTSAENSKDTPTPKPRKMKQSRTSVRNVINTDINNLVPLDESYEWNKIDKVMSEIELVAEEVSPGVEQLKNVEVSMENVSAWLNSLGLSRYEPIFYTNGFDDIAFLNGVLTDKDLTQLGILYSEHRKKIMEASSDLQKSPVLGDEDFPIPEDIGGWLAKLKLSDYERRFVHYGYDNMERIRVIWELELITVLEITTIGHYKRMIASLGIPVIRKKSTLSWSDKSKDILRKKSDALFIDDSIDVAKQLLETAESLKVERRQRLQSILSSNSNAEPNWISSQIHTEKENVSEKAMPVTDIPETISSLEWKHDSDVLLCSTVSYTMQYLGSHPVQKVQGITSTLAACSKMKILSKNIHKMPYITLAISVRGIDYIDSNNKMTINQYPINNISFCAQDPEELNIFAYITRDQFTRKHYCHVFKTESVNMTDEIIITIGQCFELAYQQHLTIMEYSKKQVSEQGRSIKSNSKPVKPSIPSQTMSLIGKGIDINIKHNNLPTKPPIPPKPFSGEVNTKL